MLNIQPRTETTVDLTFSQWVNDYSVEHETVLIDSHSTLAVIQGDGSVIAIEIFGENPISKYSNLAELAENLEIDPDDELTVLQTIDIVYNILKK